jgi:hypothetical protein
MFDSDTQKSAALLAPSVACFRAHSLKNAEFHCETCDSTTSLYFVRLANYVTETTRASSGKSEIEWGLWNGCPIEFRSSGTQKETGGPVRKPFRPFGLLLDATARVLVDRRLLLRLDPPDLSGPAQSERYVSRRA